MNVTYVYIEKGRLWCWVEGISGLERSFDEEFGTVEWREIGCLPKDRNPNLTVRQVGRLVKHESNGQEVSTARD